MMLNCNFAITTRYCYPFQISLFEIGKKCEIEHAIGATFFLFKTRKNQT